MDELKESPKRPQAPDPGVVLLTGGHANLAIPFLLKLAESHPEIWENWSNLAVAYRIVGEYEQAKHYLEKALRRNMKAPMAWANLAMVMSDLAEWDNALDALIGAAKLAPYNQQIALNLAYALLRRGRWKEAWPRWEAGRFETSWFPVPGITIWEGQDLKDKRILVQKEGGYGDSFMFMRWFPDLQERGAHVSFYVWDRQAPIFKDHPWIDRLILTSEGIDPTQFDFQTSLMSIPSWLGADSEHIPQAARYLEGKNRGLIPRNGKPLVGICWRAEENGVVRKSRTIPDALIEPLRELPVDWVSLTLGDEIPSWMKKIEIGTWAETADLVEELDLVVSVDTAIAHLAGAMGKPVWAVVPLGCHWIWFENIEHSPWYPSMRVIRNDSALSYRGAIQKLCEELKTWHTPIIGQNS